LSQTIPKLALAISGLDALELFDLVAVTDAVGLLNGDCRFEDIRQFRALWYELGKQPVKERRGDNGIRLHALARLWLLAFPNACRLIWARSSSAGRMWPAM
jgi:hypothetical protein